MNSEGSYTIVTKQVRERQSVIELASGGAIRSKFQGILALGEIFNVSVTRLGEVRAQLTHFRYKPSLAGVKS